MKLQGYSAAEIIAANEDLISEILLLLPARSLLRFKCVSKLWLSIISGPRFSRRHARLHAGSGASGVVLRRTPSDHQFLPLGGGGGDSPLSGFPFKCLDFAPDPAGLKILQSCGGLLLCCSFRKIGCRRNYYVFNPTTRQFAMLPQLGGASSCAITVYGVSLAFDPSKSSHYDVVCVRSTVESAYYYQIEIYSSRDRGWRLSGSPFVAPFDMVFDNGVFWNGGVHWISPTGASLCFDVKKEQFRTMPRLPISENRGCRRFRYFGESHGHLHFFEIYGSRTAQFKIFELEKDYSGWFVKYHVELDSIVSAFPEVVRNYMDPDYMNYYAFVMLHLVREGNNEESSLLVHLPGKILTYNVGDKTFRKLYEIPADQSNGYGSLQYGWLDAYEFIETLAPI
ncbi:F-box protein At5g07610 [Eucalyptus grandis]|nr:F-box protein At5g07610 [Eucalyptus grandis]